MSIITTAPVSESLRARASDIWNAQHEHPFVRGIGDGTLDPDRFAFWLRQDYLYLIDYARVFAMAAARSPNLATMTRFSRLLYETLETEMELHRALVVELGGTVEELGREEKAPTTQGYTDFLLRTASTGDFAELIGALLPCMWGYSEVGQVLEGRGLPDDPRYARWIASYGSPEFAELATWCRELLDTHTQGLGGEAMGRVTQAFLTSSRYELAFWEMGWHGERWPRTGG
ncbi:MAG: Thiaminase II involved in salvage of thiamin pyrimidine moiety [uncultured Thermomicrobiales bacterium]|uniref:Aminopyrimidine aminohydrolase n=1 Tax=uncultured Thermomicrobiales bacterium TaxID=1645740 RepID=A0A6J4UFC3_9BACT|nr:MAG: Thiaminase II involved in salvage of thiamin pyrimidine moiety [uncultured Thermomicrobiales bacterium]